MKIQLLTIAGGNLTILVWYCPRAFRLDISKKYLKQVEQVGFVDEMDNSVCLTMMGGELSINGTIALASLLSNNQQLFTSGTSDEIKFNNTDKFTSISIRLPYSRYTNRIVFNGIGYIVTDSKKVMSKTILAYEADKYRLPAFGQIISNKDSIQPYVFVKKTNSLVAESACGSGSIAYSIITGITRVKQPTEKYILVEKINNITFKVSAKVVLKGGDIYESN